MTRSLISRPGGCQDSAERTAKDSESGHESGAEPREQGRASAEWEVGAGCGQKEEESSLLPNAFDSDPVLTLKDRVSNFLPFLNKALPTAGKGEETGPWAPSPAGDRD